MMPPVLTCMILEDEPNASQRLERLISAQPFLKLTGSFTHSAGALQALRNNPPHLFFCDIHVPGQSGIELVRSFSADIFSTRIIFTTAYNDYASEAFNLHALDYLVKPITRERFTEAIQKAMAYFTLTAAAADKGQEDARALFFKNTLGIKERVEISAISYIEARGNYACIHCDGRELLATQNLGQITGRLPAGKFLRIHRSYTVAKNRILAIEGAEVLLPGHIRLPVGRNFKAGIGLVLG